MLFQKMKWILMNKMENMTESVLVRAQTAPVQEHSAPVPNQSALVQNQSAPVPTFKNKNSL